jgi:hypothetical protein
VAIIEVPYVADMVDRVEFDTIYHEHLSYFSLSALDRLFLRNGLAVTDVERLTLHGGSLRVFVRPAAAGVTPTPAVSALLASEAALGIDRVDYYRRFAERVEHLRSQLVLKLTTLKRQGMRIAAYGAAAKGATLLNFCGVGTEILDFVADRSTYKQGRFMPGCRLPIRTPEALLENQPDYVLLLAWNFSDEILAQQAEYRRRGGRFIVPVPEPRVL